MKAALLDRLRFRSTRRSRMTPAALATSALAASILLSACGVVSPREAPRVATQAGGDSDVSQYLETMQRLATGGPAQQADVFYEVERAFLAAPTTANTLRRAIALLTPGHPSANIAEGKKLLEQLLATRERLIPAERDLAAFLVKEADERLKLQVEIRRLTATVDERMQRQANSDRRVTALQDEIVRLRRELDEAQKKLDAVKSIERSIIERSATPPAGREPAPRE